MDTRKYYRKQLFFDRWAPNYDWLLTTIFYQAIHQRLLSFIYPPHPLRILDLGCGTGKLLNRLAQENPRIKGIGLDFSAEMIKQAQNNKKYRSQLIFIQGNADSMPFANGQFDAVFNSISFLHYRYPQRVFAEVSRVLKPQGHYYLADWQGLNCHYFPFSPAGIHFYSLQERETLGLSVGLDCLGHHNLLVGVWLSIFSKSSSI